MKYTKLILDERMIVPEPKIRLEFFLHAIVTGETCELKPKTVDEEYLYAIASGDTSRMSEIYPRTLVEIYYDAILNNSVEDLPTPRTRWEEFLRSAVTKEPCELEPESSLEIYLSQISSNGGFDYIVSTSTNSTIISLPNSINGIIKSIEMDGNTLVNYCTNGSEELTLNNETNVQGTNVTLTDTVDNGKVDVVCEGNTLILDAEGNEVEAGAEGARLVSVGELEDNKIEILSQNKNLFDIKDGWMVGRTINHITGEEITYSSEMCTDFIDIKPNTQYYLKSYNYVTSHSSPVIIYFYDINKRVIKRNDNGNGFKFNGAYEGSFISPQNAKYIRVRLVTNDTSVLVQLEEGSVTTSYVPHSLNKKEISLNEPLRALPNGVCDKFVKQGGKWYVERNCGECVLSADKNISWSRQDIKLETSQGFYASLASLNLSPYNQDRFNMVCDTLPVAESGGNNNLYPYAISFNSAFKNLLISIPKSVLSSVNSDGFNKWLSENPTTFIYQLATPTYEEITDPQLLTYLDTTHISTNSTIPCTMKIKNSGYNAIIKPSTQYTVAFDANTSREVGINLGGAKVTATNNVATITTPSTLTDDSLTLYGKGIKASNVRLLEGDKTNYIPSFFEGIKSCFEDKEQDNGSYEVEILSNNKNLFRYDSIVKRTSQSEVEYGENYVTITDAYYCGNIVKVKPFTNYYIGADITKYDANSNGSIAAYVSDGEKVGSKVMVASINGKGVFNSGNNNYVSILLYGGAGKVGKVKFSNVLLTEFTSETEYTPHKSNSIQLQLNEPLRAVGDVKDRFVLKDGRLMIERNCGKGVLGGEISLYHCWDNNPADVVNGYIYYNEHMPPLNNIKTHSNVKNNLLPSNQGGHISKVEGFRNTAYLTFSIHKSKLGISDVNAGLPNQPIIKQYFNDNPLEFIYQLATPTYEEVPTSQRLVCYEDATLFIDTNIAPTHVEIEYPTEKQQLFRIK